MTYYLSAGSTRIDGVRYVRGNALPDEAGAGLAERGFAVDDPAKISDRDYRPHASALFEKRDERSTTGGQTYTGDPELIARIAELEEELEETRRELEAANRAEEARVRAAAKEAPIVAETSAGTAEPTTAEAVAEAAAQGSTAKPGGAAKPGARHTAKTGSSS